MECTIAFDNLCPSHEFSALMANPPNMLTPAKMTGNVSRIALFFLCDFIAVLEYRYSTDGSFTALSLFY